MDRLTLKNMAESEFGASQVLHLSQEQVRELKSYRHAFDDMHGFKAVAPQTAEDLLDLGLLPEQVEASDYFGAVISTANVLENQAEQL